MLDGPTLLARELRKCTQVAFAAKSRVPQSQLSLYLNRKRRPGYDNRVAIERASDGRVPASSWSPRRAASPRRPRP